MTTQADLRVVCPTCDSRNPVTNRFCSECGDSLAEGQVIKVTGSTQAKERIASKARERKQAQDGRRWWVILVIVAVGCFVLATAAGLLTGSSDIDDQPTSQPTDQVAEQQAGGTGAETSQPVDTSEPTHAPPPTETAAPTSTPSPTLTPSITPTASQTPVPTDTNTPQPTNTPTVAPTPFAIRGQGQTATDAFEPPCELCKLRLTHNGQGNFAVWAYSGDERDLLVNTIGAYKGTTLLVADGPVILDLTADGSWTAEIIPLGVRPNRSKAEFSGKGDNVSDLFDPPETGSWEITHDGQSNFAVWLHCAGGSELVQNEIGRVSASRVVRFLEGPCFWEVAADGTWSLEPR